MTIGWCKTQTNKNITTGQLTDVGHYVLVSRIGRCAICSNTEKKTNIEVVAIERGDQDIDRYIAAIK